MSNKYQKKSVVIDAIKWNGTNHNELRDFMGVAAFSDGKCEITTLEGTLTASVGDWIIKGIKGEFYPCKPDIFEMTYEPVAKSAATPPCASRYEH